jgi:hypothetical protein
MDEEEVRQILSDLTITDEHGRVHAWTDEEQQLIAMAVKYVPVITFNLEQVKKEYNL